MVLRPGRSEGFLFWLTEHRFFRVGGWDDGAWGVGPTVVVRCLGRGEGVLFWLTVVWFFQVGGWGDWGEARLRAAGLEWVVGSWSTESSFSVARAFWWGSGVRRLLVV